MEVKIDYFSATFPLDNYMNELDPFIELDMLKLISQYLNVQPFEILSLPYAQNHYHYQYLLGEHIILRLDGPMDENYHRTCHLEMKGEGCRDFERRNPDKTWLNLILNMVCLNAKFKRIDIAIDDFEGKYVTMKWLLDKIEKEQYTSIFRNEPMPIGTLKSGLTIQFGTHDSNNMLVIYDKKIEQQRRKKLCDKEYWVRYEMRFRNQVASGVITKLITTYDDETISIYGMNLKQCAYELLYGLLDIKEENNCSDKNQHKVETDPLWSTFLNHVSKSKIPRVEGPKIKGFESYLKSAIPYVSMFLFVKFLMVNQEPELFEIELYKFMKEDLYFTKPRFHKLNIFLSQNNLKPIDDKALGKIKERFSEILEDKLLPF